MLLNPGTVIGRFEVVGPIGAGGMGEVYRARDRRLSREVAVKILGRNLSGTPAYLGRFEQEARALAALAHPNVVVVYELDVDAASGVMYIATELLEGETLRARLERGPLSWRSASEIAADIASGLACCPRRVVPARRGRRAAGARDRSFARGGTRVPRLFHLLLPMGAGAGGVDLPTRDRRGRGLPGRSPVLREPAHGDGAVRRRNPGVPTSARARPPLTDHQQRSRLVLLLPARFWTGHRSAQPCARPGRWIRLRAPFPLARAGGGWRVAVAIHSHRAVFLDVEPAFDAMREEPEFRSLVAQVGIADR